MGVERTIVLKGRLSERHLERLAADGNTKPGYLLEFDSNGKVKRHSTKGGKCGMIAKEDALQGNTLDSIYTTGNPVMIHRWQPNTDLLHGRVAAGAGAILRNDPLRSAGDGTVEKATDSTNLYTNTAASAAITASSTEEAFDKSYTIPANSLAAGDVIRIRGQVIATATNSTDTLTVKLYIGGMAGTAIFTTGAVDVANGDVAVFDVILIVRTVGATGTFVASGYAALGVPGTVTAKAVNLGSTAIDTTAAKDLVVSGKWSTTDAGNSCRLDQLVVEKLNTGGSYVVGYAEEAVDNSLESDEAMIQFWAA